MPPSRVAVALTAIGLVAAVGVVGGCSDDAPKSASESTSTVAATDRPSDGSTTTALESLTPAAGATLPPQCVELTIPYSDLGKLDSADQTAASLADDALEVLRNRLPADLRGDLETVAEVSRLMNSDPGRAAEQMSSPEVNAASQRIGQWFSEGCPTR